MAEERGDEIERISGRVFEHDRRILTLETNGKVMDSEINSLRATRHEHSNWLNRHNLEVSELNLKMLAMTAQYATLCAKADKMEKDFNALQLSISTQLSAMKSDLRQTMWVVSLVVGILVFVGRGLAAKWGF